jgi:hypothetical protein
MDDWYVAATGTLPLQGGFSLLGKLGVAANKVSGGQICAAGTCDNFAAGDSKTDAMVGIGALKADAWNISVNYAF